jgi:hypothetical protein
MAHRTNEDNQRDSMEEKEIYKRIKELELINESHKDLNGKLRTQLTLEKKKTYTMVVHETLCYRFKTKAYNITEAKKKLEQQVEKADWGDVSPDDSDWKQGNVEELNNE